MITIGVAILVGATAGAIASLITNAWTNRKP